MCPAGTPHSVSDGVLLIELQEPTDFSVLLETRGFPVSAEDARLGLPKDVAMSCVATSATPPELVERWRTPAPGSLLPRDAAPFFRAIPIEEGDILTEMSVLVVTDGSGDLVGEWQDVRLQRGTTVLIPAASAPVTVRGQVRAVACQPPA